MADPQPSTEIGKEKLPEMLPVLPLFDTVLFPKMVLPLVVMQEDSIKLVDEAMTKNRMIGLLVSKKVAEKPASDPPDAQPTEQKPAVVAETEKTEPDQDLYQTGTTALILKMAKTEENKAQLLVQGLGRFRVKDFIEGKPYLQANVDHLEDVEKQDKETKALISNLHGLFHHD